MRHQSKYYYNRNGDKVKIGYAIFRYIGGTLQGLSSGFYLMSFSKDVCAIWPEPPVHYFYPQNGDFFIKTSRVYSDLKILGYSNTKSNYFFEIK